MGITITIIIILMTCLISYQAFNNPLQKGSMLFMPTAIKSRGEYYRFITSGFIHADWMHLGVNMYVLWAFGEQVERTFIDSVFFGPLWGKIAYLAFYISAIAIASFPSYLRHQDDYGYGALGASGATSAILFAFIVVDPWSTLTFVFFPFIKIPAIVLGVGYLWYSSYMDKRGTDNIGHNAHFSGAIYGVLFMVFSAMAYSPELWNIIIHRFMNPVW